jgi:hypothetical protein
MHPQIDKLCVLLDEVVAALMPHAAEARPQSLIAGWNVPSLTYSQLLNIPMSLSDRLKQADIQDIDNDTEFDIAHICTSLAAFIAQTLPYMINGNLAGAIAPFTATFDFVTSRVNSLIGPNWNTLPAGAVPGALARRAQRLQRDLDLLVPEVSEVAAKLKTIVDAHDAAEAFPADVQYLKQTQIEIQKISSVSSEIIGQIKEHNRQSTEELSEMKSTAKEASSLLQQASDVYSSTTTVALASSFAARAESLNKSVFWWVLMLGITLTAAVIIGAIRIYAMKDLLSSANLDWAKVSLQMVLSILSVGGPVWFAWISTKQIGQRFRLAEDYAFKESVAKAYEGYRKEAVRLDPEFARALFASALMRFNEEPLRLVEPQAFGSPAHELASSNNFKEIIMAVLQRAGLANSNTPDSKQQPLAAEK